MEEDEEDEETFWYHCARLVKALTIVYLENNECRKTISEICIFLHKHCMQDGGRYSKNGRMVDDHIGVDPVYINEYMETLDVFYKVHKHNENIGVLTYYNFITIHPFSDGNGCVGKALFFILRGKFKERISQYKGITTKKNHRKLCKQLGVLQRKIDSMFNVNINVDILKKLLD